VWLLYRLHFDDVTADSYCCCYEDDAAANDQCYRPRRQWRWSASLINFCVAAAPHSALIIVIVTTIALWDYNIQTRKATRPKGVEKWPCVTLIFDLCNRVVATVGISGVCVCEAWLTLYRHIKTAEQRTVIQQCGDGTLAVDGWAVTFDTARRGLGGLGPGPVPSLLYQM